MFVVVFLTVSPEDYDNTSIRLPDFATTDVIDTQCITLSAVADMILEASQSFNVTLTSSNANVDPTTSTVTVTIIDANSMLY